MNLFSWFKQQQPRIITEEEIANLSTERLVEVLTSMGDEISVKSGNRIVGEILRRFHRKLGE